MPKDYYAELSGARVAPLDAPYAAGISTSQGKTLPFIVERQWAGPAGHYNEQWSIRQGAQVVYESEVVLRFVRGFQSVSAFRDIITEPIPIAPGTYSLVFIMEGRFMGAVDIEVRDEAGGAAA